MRIKDVPRVLKGLITGENVSDDEIRAIVVFLVVGICIIASMIIL